mgnify:CR=1 FL=1
MQPYFFPYIGYFQLINAVDIFVVYDNLQYTKRGWINRNKILHSNEKTDYITIPIKKDSSALNINERYISKDWNIEKNKIKNKLKSSYSKAGFFLEAYQIIQECLDLQNHNLFDFIFESLKKINSHLKIKTHIIKSSQISIDHSLRSVEKVIAICDFLNAEIYINSIGGRELYSREYFKSRNIDLKFLKTDTIKYNQNTKNFHESLSIIDVMMHNSVPEITKLLNSYNFY